MFLTYLKLKTYAGISVSLALVKKLRNYLMSLLTRSETTIPRCECCEVLKEQLAIERLRFDKLLALTIAKETPEEVKQVADVTPIKVGSFTPWRVKQQMLEEEDRRKAQVMQSKTEELEKEILMPVEGVSLNG